MYAQLNTCTCQSKWNRNTCTAQQVRCLQVHVHCDMDSVYFVCLGARADIKDEDGKTPLEEAEQELAKTSNPEEKQRYEKVHEDTHTITHFDTANGC